VLWCGLRAVVLGRLGGLSPPKSECSNLPIVRVYGVALMIGSSHPIIYGPGFTGSRPTPVRARFYG
jgi:hypothetical protein